MLTARFAPDKAGKKMVYYVHIPAKVDADGVKRAERARPAQAMAMEFYYPHPPLNEIIYVLSNDKKINQNALYGTKEECEEACEKINQEIALAQASPTLKKDKPKGIENLTNP